MKNTTVKFIDSYGISHDAAVLELSYGYKNVSKTETVGTSGQEQQSVSVNFQFKYWHSKDAKDLGCQAMQLMDKNGQNTFGAYPTSESEIGELEDYCINQLINVVLKGIDANAKVIS